MSEAPRPLLTRAVPGSPRQVRPAPVGPLGRTALRALSVCGTLLACLLLVAPWAVLSARTEASFGPHMAEYSVTSDSAITVDLGPLGSLLVPASDLLPLGLGVHIDVREIPQESALGGTTLDALGQDVASYATFFTAPDAQIRVVVRGLIRDASLRLGGAGLGLAAVAGVLVMVRGPRSRRPPRRTTLGLVAGTAAAVLAAGMIVPLEPQRTVVASPAFTGTALEGAQVTGRLGGVIDEVAALVDDFTTANDRFYSTALSSLDRAWWQRPSSARVSSVSHLVPPPAESMWRRGTIGDSITTVVMASDIHCNIGMARVVGDIVARTGAELYVDGGDITMTGTPAENLCVDSVDHELPANLPKIFVKGNHDSADTAAHARSLGWHVMDNAPIEVAGLRFFGGPDPRRTVFGRQDPVLETGETSVEFTERMARDACEAGPDVLLIHDPRHAEAALAAGCAPLGLSGHWHRRVGPEPFGQGTRYVSSTTGGALADALTPGPLKMPAEISILRFDLSSGALLDLQVVTIDMDAQIEFSPWLPARGPGPWASAEDRAGSTDPV